MYKLGLKLWSVNENYVNEAIRLYEERFYDFIELYSIPDSFNDYIKLWKPIKIPFIIHAPHFRQGVNLAKEECLEQNIRFAREAQKFADKLKAEYIIFHPGIAGNPEETVRQLNIINDSRILIENKPYYTVLNDGNICNGNSPEEIKIITENAKIGFCLDIGHCFCSANAQNIQPYDYLKEFLLLNPKMFHLTDNDFSSITDKHLHFGEGNIDIEKTLNYLHYGAKITLETNKDSTESLDDFVKDIEVIRKFDFEILKATESDIEDVFNLSNDPIVRQNSFNPEQINFENHVKWFKNKIKSGDCYFYIIRNNNNNFIGYVRFDKNTDIKDEMIISIHLNQKYRGKGFGSKLIKISSEKILKNHSIKKIIAFVKDTNNTSLKSFEKSGYKVISKDNINNNFWYKLEKHKVNNCAKLF